MVFYESAKLIILFNSANYFSYVVIDGLFFVVSCFRICI